jgi:hypothetical protein
MKFKKLNIKYLFHLYLLSFYFELNLIQKNSAKKLNKEFKSFI